MTPSIDPLSLMDRQPWPKDRWCVGCTPETCSGCRPPAAAEPDDTTCILSPGHMRTILLGAGFTIKSGESDLKPYVYAAARALIREALALQAGIPAPPEPRAQACAGDRVFVDESPAAPTRYPFVYHYHATVQLSPGRIQHSDGAITCREPLSTIALYDEAKLRIAAFCGFAHAPNEVTLCSLALLNPLH